MTGLENIPFTKMHGAGNDFVVLDLRGRSEPTPELCAAMSDRNTGIGCDLVLGIEPPRSPRALVSFRIWTSDGQTSQQCGNGARCIAAWAQRTGLAASDAFELDSPSGPIEIMSLGRDTYSVKLAPPSFDPDALPLHGFKKQSPPYSLETPEGNVIRFGTVSMGNPHAVIEVQDLKGAPVKTVGRLLQNVPELPDTICVGFVEIVDPDHLQLRVFEFGAGETLACGSGACAAASYLMQQGRVNRDVSVSMPGGTLQISWPDNHQAPITMTGPAAFVFEGEFPYATI